MEQKSPSTGGAAAPRSVVRFGEFELDLRTAELRGRSQTIRLQEQPFLILVELLERPGKLVSREEIRQRLWPEDTTVEFDHSINVAVKRLRDSLGDSAENPRFIETLAKRGYRFIAPVESDSLQTEPDLIEKNAGSSKNRRRPLPFRPAILTAAILAVGLVAAVWIAFLRPQGGPRVMQFTRLTGDGQRKIGPLVSDGVRIYFNEWLPDGRLIIVQASIKGGEVTPFSIPLKAPFIQDISNDGTELLVANDEGAQGRSIWVQPVAGGSPHRVGSAFTSWGPMGPGLAFAAFSADGAHILYSHDHDVFSVRRDGSDLRNILTLGHLSKDFQHSPDSRVLRFTQFDPLEQEKIMSAIADRTALHELVDGCCGHWTPNGRYFVFARESNHRSDLWALPERAEFRWQRRKNTPIQLTAGPLDFQLPLPAKSGTEIFAIGTSHRAEFVRYDRTKSEFVPYLSGISAADLAFSADGQWIVYTSLPDGDLWRSRADGTQAQQLTSAPMKVSSPRWSPDGKQIAFIAILPKGVWNIYAIPSAGGSAKRLVPSDRSQLGVDWSPDGKSLVYEVGVEPQTEIHFFDLNSSRVSALTGSKGLYGPNWSPDGRYISGLSTDSGNLMLFETATQRWTKPCDCVVDYPEWSHDGKYLYFHLIQEPDKGNRIARLRMGDSKIENVADVSGSVRWTALTVGQWFGLAPDDSPLVVRNIGSQEIYALEMQWK